jgi:hypothetical protein
MSMSGWKALILLCITGSLSAAELHSEHTYGLEEGEARPKATLDDAEMLVGNWTGTAFDQKFEETWSAPSQDSMVGMFKLYGDEGVGFYELMLLTVDDGSLSLKVKHFSSDFVAWEDKPDYVNFKLVKVEPHALHFSGLSFYRRDANTIDAYILIRNGEETTEHEMKYVRSP